ncbi:hypothetical protein O181_111120 [Austropuccinia psidii MF-1]|uniref:Retrotransposon gag domain-containing protein n=1 Tax=Austropuccinia psidii MF-1 TaxID=1389203 RepID=A0A9Q3K1S3_9BASI|nr:hypothetical protein [Austropuccinia psidii MF-1]
MEDLSILNINDKLRIMKDHVLGITKNTNQFATHLAKSDSERQKLKNEIIANVEQIHKNYEPHMPRNSTSLTEEKLSVKGSLTPFLGENVISAKDIPKLEEWPKFSGEGEYNHIEFIRTFDMLQEEFHIPDNIIVGKLHSLFTRTAKKWYYKMRQDHGKHDWSWWKSEMITRWANNSWRFKMENAFESAIFNSEKDKKLTWFFNQKDRLSAFVTTMAIHLPGSPYGISSHSSFMANWPYPSPVANMATSLSYGPLWPFVFWGLHGPSPQSRTHSGNLCPNGYFWSFPSKPREMAQMAVFGHLGS